MTLDVPSTLSIDDSFQICHRTKTLYMRWCGKSHKHLKEVTQTQWNLYI